MNEIEIGRMLRAGTSGFIIGCRVNQLESPSFGALVRVPVETDYQIYGLIHDIHIDDDGLVRQLVTADGVAENVIADNRLNRNIPIEISVLAVGYRQGGKVYHLLPPRPALSLDRIFLCGADELVEFTSAGRFGYFRHLLRTGEYPIGELFAAHLKQAQAAHNLIGSDLWYENAVQELIILLRDDYDVLMEVLNTVADLSMEDV